MGLVVKLALLLSLGAGSVGWSDGYAVGYAPGKMERVAARRGIEAQPCMVAWTVARDSDVGERWLLVEGARTGVRRRCLVVDLPERRDRPNLVQRGILVELDYQSSRAICGKRWQGKATECPVQVSADD